MKVIITEWGTDSYFDLVIRNSVISKIDYKNILRPDVELLKSEKGFPLRNTKFSNHKFWSPATSNGSTIQNGYKMKWHNFGNGKYQLRLCIGVLNDVCFICRAYVKEQKTEKREMANLKIHLRNIMQGNYVSRGQL